VSAAYLKKDIKFYHRKGKWFKAEDFQKPTGILKNGFASFRFSECKTHYF
jgi:hypothetical protein